MPSFPFSFSHMSFDSFPRLDPPPPSGKKRIPRALKTTQDMMISSDPVVSSPDPVTSSPDHIDAPSSSPAETPPNAKEKLKDSQKNEVQESTNEETGENGRKMDESEKVDGVTEGGDGDVEDGGREEAEEKHQLQLQLSVPDLINKEPPVLEARDKPSEVWVKVSDSRLASTPCPGKTPCRISLGEEVLLGNGAPCSRGKAVSPEECESHPDLLSFE